MSNRIYSFILSILLLGLCFAVNPTVQAQKPYESSVGLRVGWSNGIAGKFFMQDALALEAILGYHATVVSYYGGTNLTGLFEYHIPLEEINRLYLYVGGGAHFTIGTHRRYSYDHPYYYGYNRRYVGMGFDVIGGMEYILEDVPISISVDFKPYFTIPFADVREYPYVFGDVGVTARYLF